MNTEPRLLAAARALFGGWLLLLSAALALHPHAAHGFARYGGDGVRLLLAGSEIVAAVLFLLPASAAVGEAALLAVFAFAAVLHLTAGENPAVLGLYALAVLLLGILRRRSKRA
jgi:hypothetical protein